ncbi:hypothetical protein HanPSC8_Chr02g0081431 [Helianthus annuus]|nr:hypothetical protein HanPSC8_Chr02g0081431 [Helianthus annuus]
MYVCMYVYLLGVPAIGYRLILIVFKYNMLQQTVRHIFNDMPLNGKITDPFVLLPILQAFVKINWAHHFRNTNKLTACIDLKEKKDGAFFRLLLGLLVCSIEFLISVLCTRPNVILYTFMNIIFTIRFNNKKLSICIGFGKLL